MSILIKGMEMPECCGYCPFEYKKYCMAKPSLMVESADRHPSCPLVQVPPRGGRVMTYDELMESILTAQEQMLKHGIEANSVTLNGRKYGKLIENLPPNMKPTIFGMAVKAEYALPDDYDFLVQYEPPKPLTNADKLRSMSDEELAEWLERIRLCCSTDLCGRSCPFAEVCYSNADQPIETLNWLRQEASDG